MNVNSRAQLEHGSTRESGSDDLNADPDRHNQTSYKSMCLFIKWNITLLDDEYYYQYGEKTHHMHCIRKIQFNNKISNLELHNGTIHDIHLYYYFTILTLWFRLNNYLEFYGRAI
uniref:Uncharacterized protein n=1 Tax=Romanomermis culicivorax TaxID=13658 RepID=A0A915I7Z4_ROMCU